MAEPTDAVPENPRLRGQSFKGLNQTLPKDRVGLLEETPSAGKPREFLEWIGKRGANGE